MSIRNIALFGLGRMGQIHLTNILADPRLNLKYIYDPSPRADRIASPHIASLIVEDAQRIFNDDSIDACVIATPSTSHAELITLCAHAGKHVLCEKPVSFNVDTLLALRDIVERAGISLQIGFNRRFDPSFARIKHSVSDGSIGAINVIKITNRDPVRPHPNFVKDSGGLFFDFNIHDFDMLRFISGEEVREVFALGDALIDAELKTFNDIDTAVILLKMSRGSLAVIDSSRETNYGYDQQLEVFGAKGMLHMKNQPCSEVSRITSDGRLSDAIHHSFVERYHESYRSELANFFTNLGACASPDINDAIAAVRVANAAHASLHANQPICVTE